MWITMILAVAGKIFDVFGLATKLQISKEDFLAKVEIAKLETASEVLVAAADVIKTEATGESWLQRCWRPLVALTSFFSYFFVIFIYPFFIAWGLLPQVRFGEAGLNNMWNLVLVCVGGYMAGRTFEKIVGK